MNEGNLFILGAGFTKAVFDNAPLNRELVPRLIEANPSSDLKELSQKYGNSDIEFILTQLDLDIHFEKQTQDTRDGIVAEIAEYFQQFRFFPERLREQVWLEKFARRVFKQNDTIVNLNYDCCLDGLLDYLNVWHPFDGGYGHDCRIENPLVDDSVGQNPKNIRILKIHGSENFTYQPFYDKPESGVISYEYDERIFPGSAKDKHLGNRSLPQVDTPLVSTSKAYLIAPSFIKIPRVQISYLIINAIQAARSARRMVIIGCSLRDEDVFLKLILTAFLKELKKGDDKKYIIVGPQATSIAEKIMLYWGVDVEQEISLIEKRLEDAVDCLCELSQ